MSGSGIGFEPGAGGQMLYLRQDGQGDASFILVLSPSGLNVLPEALSNTFSGGAFLAGLGSFADVKNRYLPDQILRAPCAS